MNFDLSSFDLTQQQHQQRRSISIKIVLKRKRLRYYMKRDLIRRKRVLEMNQDYRRPLAGFIIRVVRKDVSKGNSLRKPS